MLEVTLVAGIDPASDGLRRARELGIEATDRGVEPVLENPERYPLVFGPEPHRGGSTYHRPGDEWGTGFRFTTTGCWHIHLARDDNAGEVWIDV